MTEATLHTGSRDSGAWRWSVLLVAPFVVCTAVLLATGWTFPTFWGDDENNHWALIQWFAQALPRFHANYPATATTPLFHLVGACVVRLIGPHLPLLRAGNAALSAGGVLVLYATLRRTFGRSLATAALLSAAVGLSGYYFGYAFRLLTDNMAFVGCLLATGQLFRSVDPSEPRPRRRFLYGCLWVGLTLLTRQSYIFLCVPFGWTLLAAPFPPRQKLAGVLALGLSLVPLAALMAAWRGSVPPDYQKLHATGLLHLYPLALPIMLLGLYAPFFLGPTLWRRWRSGDLPPRWWLGPAAGAAVAVVTLILFPLFPVADRPDLATYIPAEGRENWSLYFGGWVYSLAGRGGSRTLFHNPLFFWLALPLGGAALAWFLPEAWKAPDTRRRVAARFLLGVLFASLLNAVSSQKYYDALVLLFLVWRTDGDPARDPWRRRALYALIAVFCVYAAAFPYLSRSQELHLAAPVLTPPAP